MSSFWPAALALCGLLPLLAGLRVVAEHERLIVLRRGHTLEICRPGLHWVIPQLDRVLRVDLDRSIPDWRGLTSVALEQRLAEIAIDERASAE